MQSKDKSLVKSEKGKAKKVELVADFGTVYIKQTSDGQIMRPIRATMSLFKKMGHFYNMKGDDFAVTKAGYIHLNKVASVSIVTPPKVIVDGIEQHNPHIERNPRTKLTESVFIRKMGIGFGPMGNIVVIDKTLSYNIYAYFIESIQSKMKKVKWKDNQPTDERIHPNCGMRGVKSSKPEDKGRWAFYETAAPLGIWVNYDDPIIIACLNEHTQRQRFGDRIAQSIVERNILKSHPAIGVDKIEPQAGGKRAFVEVYGYRNELGPQQINDIMAQADKGTEEIKVEAENIESISEEEEAQAVKEEAQIIEDVEEEEVKEEKEKKDSPAKQEEPPDEFFLKQEEEKAKREKEEG